MFVSVLLAAALAAPAAAADARIRHKSRRFELEFGKKKAPAPKRERRIPKEAAVEPEWSPKRLAPGRWRGEVGAALERLLESYGRGVEGYSEYDPPAAVVVFDDAAVHGSIGEAVFRRMVEDASFKFSEDFFRLIPIQFGRQRVRAGWLGFQGQPRAVWGRDAHYLMYRKAFLKSYQDYCSEFGRARCRTWLAQLLSGWDERELLRLTRVVIADELRRPVAVERVEEVPADPAPVLWGRGLRKVPEMEDLFRRLKEKGFDVWVLSSSSNWSVEEFAREYGVHRSRILAVRVKVDGETLSAQPLAPIPEGPGRPEAVATFLGRSPELIIGDENDDELMGYGRGLRIQIVEPSAAAPKAGRRWLVQPRLSPVRAPQERSVEF